MNKKKERKERHDTKKEKEDAHIRPETSVLTGEQEGLRDDTVSRNDDGNHKDGIKHHDLDYSADAPTPGVLGIESVKNSERDLYIEVAIDVIRRHPMAIARRAVWPVTQYISLMRGDVMLHSISGIRNLYSPHMDDLRYKDWIYVL